MHKTICPIGYIKSDFSSKFGIPRQSGIANLLKSEIHFCDPYRSMEAIRGLEGFSHIWLIWDFSEVNNNGEPALCDNDTTAKSTKPKLTVRPPKLGGNKRVGVFATRSPFRPNGLGLSSVKIEEIKEDPATGPMIIVSGADLMDGTPIYDIKPYITFDVHEDAAFGFQNTTAALETLEVEFPENLLALVPKEKRDGLVQTLAQDPRPGYQHEPDRVYGFAFAGFDVRFTCDGQKILVTDVMSLK